MLDKKYKILIVEDTEYIAKILKDRVSKLGYEVIGNVDTGEEAFKLAKNNNPDLILMDVLLKSHIDGVEAAKKIIKTLNIPIIFVTGCCEIDFLEKVKDISSVKYLLKPFRDIELYTLINSVLNNQ